MKPLYSVEFYKGGWIIQRTMETHSDYFDGEKFGPEKKKYVWKWQAESRLGKYITGERK